MHVPVNASMEELNSLVALSLNYLTGSDTHPMLDTKLTMEEISELLDRTDVDPKLRKPDTGMTLDDAISSFTQNTHNASFGRALRAIPGTVPTAYIEGSLTNEDIAPDYLSEYFKDSTVEPLNIRELTDMFYGTVDQFHQTVQLIKRGEYNTTFISLTNPDFSFPCSLSEREALMIGRSIKTPLVGLSFNKEFFGTGDNNEAGNRFEEETHAWVITPCISAYDEVYNNFINVFVSVVALVIKELTKVNVQARLFDISGVNYSLELDFSEFSSYNFNSIKPVIDYVQAN